MLIVWGILSAKKINKDANTTINKVATVINVLLYLFFIAIVLIFNFTSKYAVEVCLGAIVQNSTPSGPQRSVSIAYAVIISAVSCLMAIFSVFYGMKLINLSKNAAVKGNARAKLNSIFIHAGISGFGFLLNCIFILVATGASPGIVFTFVGLIVSEIIPAMYMLIAFGPFGILVNYIRACFGLKPIASTGTGVSGATSSTGTTSSTGSTRSTNSISVHETTGSSSSSDSVEMEAIS